jgi:hypothetical protein
MTGKRSRVRTHAFGKAFLHTICSTISRFTDNLPLQIYSPTHVGGHLTMIVLQRMSFLDSAKPLPVNGLLKSLGKFFTNQLLSKDISSKCPHVIVLRPC